MPLMVSLESSDRPRFEFKPQPLIEAGCVGAWADKSLGAARFLVARCMQPDTGAEIYIVEDSYRSKSGSLVIPFSEFDFQEIILPGLKLVKDVIDHDDENMRITFQHVMPDGKINSLN
jgi:hypothetical protein